MKGEQGKRLIKDQPLDGVTDCAFAIGAFAFVILATGGEKLLWFSSGTKVFI